jgi:PAS domain S-box-containing protein
MVTRTSFSSLARALATGAQPGDVLPELHREVLTATGGAASVVLQRARRSGDYHATSGRGFANLRGPWLPASEAATLEARTSDGPVAGPLAGLPALSARLGSPQALIVPLSGTGEPAYLIVAGSGFNEEAIEIGARAHVEFGLALRLARLARQGALHQRLQELFLAFSRGISATLSLSNALETLARDANALFGCGRTSIWLHDRRARRLTLSAASDGAHTGSSIPTDAQTPAARGMRLDRPHIELDAGQPVLLAPLRGWRRALGTIVMEGSAADLDDQEFAEAAYELARQLSGAVENVQLLDEVLQQRRLLEDTFNSIVDLVVVTDKALHVVQMNEAFAARLGAARPSLLQRPLTQLIGGEMAAWVADQAPGARTRQFTDDALGGIFAATITPLIKDGEPVGQVLVIRDITAQVQLEREQEALRKRLGQSEKLASLGQFVAGIAHEMNNPLQGVLGHLELLIATDEAAKPLRPTLRRIYHEGDRAAKIVRNLLVFAGSRRMARQQVRVHTVISRALTSRRAALRRAGITVVRETAEGAPAISGDPQLLQQAFLNMLINAEHAIAAAGKGGRVEIAITAPGSVVRTTIRDSGAGIAPDVLPRIFDPFFTTKDVGQGTGLGLAITYGIIQDHGGTIHAANAPDGGAVFTVDLPASTPR